MSLFGKLTDLPLMDVAARIKADPQHAQAIWDEYYKVKFGAMDRNLAASVCPKK